MKSSTSYSLQQIRESGLLSDQRQAEVEAAIQARIQPAKLANGGDLPDFRIATLDDGKNNLFNVASHSGAEEYMVRCILPHVLTPEEFDRIEKHCLSGRQTRLDAERFAKAVKISAAQYDGYVYDGDEYYSSVEEFLEQLDGAPPEFVWACDGRPVIGRLDVGDIVESRLCDNGWEDMSTGDLNGVKEFQAACDAFVKANESVVAYRPDYTRAIILETKKEDAES